MFIFGMENLSNAEDKAIFIVPKITASLSMIGSAIIIWRFFFSKDKTMEHNTNGRLVLGMSCMDFIGSLFFFFGTWTYDYNDAGDPMTSGWCKLQGFILQLNATVFFYNGVIAVHYLLKIKYKVYVKRYEILLHLSAWIFPIVTSFISLGLGMYGPSGPWCWISSNFGWARWAFFYAELWAIMIISACVMGILVNHVREQEKVVNTTMHVSKTTNSSRRITEQTCLYVSVFILTWLFGTINRIYGAIHPDKPVFVLTILHTVFVPLQGFFNFLVYFYPRYRSYRRKNRLKRPTKSLGTSKFRSSMWSNFSNKISSSIFISTKKESSAYFSKSFDKTKREKDNKKGIPETSEIKEMLNEIRHSQSANYDTGLINVMDSVRSSTSEGGVLVVGSTSKDINAIVFDDGISPYSV